MAVTSPEVKKALEVIFAADSDIYQTRGFQRRIGYGARPALVIIDLANAWTKPGYAFTCDDMDVIIPTNQALLKAARAKRIPVIYTTTAYQDPKGPRSDTGLWHLKIPAETLYENSEAAAIDERIAPEEGEMVICKKSASAFYGTNLNAYLHAQRVDTVILTGVTMAGCVRHSVEDAIDRVLTTYVTNGPTDEELERQKAQIEYDMVSRLQSILAKADMLNRYEFFFDQPDALQRDLDRYRKAERSSVQRVAYCPAVRSGRP